MAVASGGPPPPPPPPMANGVPAWKLARQASAPAGPPSRKLKPFFWEKSTTAVNVNNVWGKIGSIGVPVELDDLEDVFSLDQASSKPTSASQVVKSKKQVTTLLDITRANNVAIMLKTLKLSPAAICEAILSIDDATRIRDFGDTSKLAEADQYFSQILSIPRLQERLACMIYRRRLELEIIEAQPDLSMLHDAAAELCASDRLRKLFQIVLAVGNALNKSTFRGGASGFKLKSLLKLKETKTAKPDSACPTLLHYVARVLIRTEPATILFGQEIPHVESAARISVPTVMAAVTNIEAGLKKATSEIIACRKAASSPLDKFGAVMQPFIRSSGEGVHALKSMADSTQAKLAEMVAYFGETTEGPEATKPEDIFELMMSFSSALQKTALEVNATMAPLPPVPSPKVPLVTLEDDESAATPKQEKPEFLSVSDPSGHGSISSVSLSVGRGDLDQAIRSMRTGRRQPRQERPLSKIFLDGGQNTNRRSRLFE